MATARGFKHIMGVKQETTLGTVVAVTAKVPMISDNLDQRYQHLQNATLTGSGAPRNSIQSTRVVQGGWVAYMDYGLIHPVLKAFFGNHTVNSSADNTYVMQETIDGIGLTVAIDKQVSVHEYAGYKIGEFTLSGSPADGVRYAVNGFALARSLASGTNTSGVLAALSESANEMQFFDLSGSGYLRVGAVSGALSSSDNQSISGFALSINRNLQQDQINSNTLLEALEANFRAGTLTLQVPRYTTDQWITWHNAHTVLQAEFLFDNGTDAYKKIRLPQLQVVSVPVPTPGPGLLPLTITLSLHNNRDAGNANTGFTFTQEIQILEEDGS